MVSVNVTKTTKTLTGAHQGLSRQETGQGRLIRYHYNWNCITSCLSRTWSHADRKIRRHEMP